MNKPTRTLLFAACAASLAMLMGGCNKAPDPIVSVSPPGAAAARVSDLDTSANVRKALAGNDLVKALDIKVVTVNGEVQLSGVLDSQAQIDEALKTARMADGAQTVKDQLSVKK